VPTPWLDDNHSIFGAVEDASDQAVVDSIEQGDTIESLTVTGDVDALLEAKADRVAEWNAVLN